MKAMLETKMKGILIILLAIGSINCFMDYEKVQRITNVTELSQKMLKTNKMISIYLHKGECKKEGCDDFEAVIKNFVDDNEHKMEHMVADCEQLINNAEEEREGEGVPKLAGLDECFDEETLPRIIFLQAPLKKYDPANKRYFGKRDRVNVTRTY